MITIVTKRHRVCPTPTLDMSAEFDDVLTNQPIVIDNVRYNPNLPEKRH